MSAVTAVSQRYTERGSGVRKWCDGGQERCYGFRKYFRGDDNKSIVLNIIAFSYSGFIV